MRYLFPVLLAMLLALVTTDMCFGADTSAYEKASQSAESNAATPEGKAFERRVAKWFGTHHAATMDSCTNDVPASDLQPFDLLLQLTLDGRIEKAITRQESSVATCVRKAMENGVIAEPPTDHYWIHISMSVRE